MLGRYISSNFGTNGPNSADVSLNNKQLNKQTNFDSEWMYYK